MPAGTAAAFKPGDTCITCGLKRCACIRCALCRDRIPKKHACDKCHSCSKHHKEYYPKDFPHRKCDYLVIPGMTVERLPETTFAINPLHRTIGVEVELGAFPPFVRQNTNGIISWSMHHDGSVQGSGEELVTDRMRGDQYVYGMGKLIRDLTNGGANVNESCGYHVHVDGAEMGPMDLRRIMVAFQLIQDNLYGSLVNKKRGSGTWGQTYCPKLRNDINMLMGFEDKADFINWLHLWLYQVQLPAKSDYVGAESLYKETLRGIDAQLKQYKGTKYMNRARRWALNIHSWMMRGTVEFRLKEGTLDPGDIMLWPLWCAWFIEKFGNASDKDVLYFMKKGLSLPAANEFMAEGSSKMPAYVANWVKSKL